ncbi:MAG: hypothetical protein J7639_01505 [Paenibacillaceae bacterium]|nr:hypothetical protein [Paenibacillaceae bacterium]
MSRYTYYHVLYVGMINIMMFVPYLLIRDRFNGAVSGMLVAVVVASALSLTAMVCFERFPGLGFPEICDCFMPRWLTNVLNCYAALFVWVPAGVIVIYSYAETARMFFYPDMNKFLNLLLLVGAAVWASSRSTRTVQFIQEIVILTSAPLLLLFLIKAVFNEHMDWHAIRYVAGYVRKPPSFVSIAAATFLFSGYLSLVVFNRLHVKGFRFRFKWIVPLFGLCFLAITFFVPIGFHGTVAVQDYVYLWSMTADSMALQYGFIDRVLYFFLLLFVGLSLLFVMNTWHIAIMLFRHTLTRFTDVEETQNSGFNAWVAIALGVIAFVYMYFTNTERNQKVSEWWIYIRFFTEIVFSFVMIYCARKKMSSEKATP